MLWAAWAQLTGAHQVTGVDEQAGTMTVRCCSPLPPDLFRRCNRRRRSAVRLPAPFFSLAPIWGALSLDDGAASSPATFSASPARTALPLSRRCRSPRAACPPRRTPECARSRTRARARGPAPALRWRPRLAPDVPPPSVPRRPRVHRRPASSHSARCARTRCTTAAPLPPSPASPNAPALARACLQCFARPQHARCLRRVCIVHGARANTAFLFSMARWRA